MTNRSSSDKSSQSSRTDIDKANAPVLSGEFNAPVSINYQAHPEKFILPHQIPPPPLDFTGRDDELKDLIAQFDRGATISGFRGMGGIGKTVLALVLAEKLKGRFGDGQVFLKLNGTSPNPLMPNEAMAQVVRAFRGPAERLPEDKDELQSLYNSVLEGKNVLLLLDNADDRKQVQPLLPPMGCAVIVTSRKKFTLPGMPEPFFLDILKPSEAKELLLKICPRLGSQAEELAKLCDYLPLALRASASLLAVKSDLNPESYVEELRSERTRLEKIGKEGVDLDVEASFNLSYIRLSAEMASVFCKLSIFPSDFSSMAEEAVCQDQGHNQLSNLVTWSLVEFEEGTSRYYLHDLARIFAASRLEVATKAEIQKRHAEHYGNMLSSATQTYIQGNPLDALRKFDAEWMNIQAGWIWAKQNYKVDNLASSLCNAYLDWPFLLELRLHPKERVLWLETGLAASRKVKNRSMESVNLGSLGNAYVALGNEKKAIEFYEQALVITHEIGDRRNEGVWLCDLGAANFALGDAKKAIEFYEQALDIVRKIGHRRVEGIALGNLGVANFALGDANKAIEFYEQALVIFHEIKDLWGEGNVLGYLGASYYALGDAKKAIEFYEQHFVIAREIGDMRGEGSALFNLSLIKDNLGQRVNAINHARTALNIYEQIESPHAERVRQTLAEWQKQ